jgi:hypothetical protein
MGMHVFRAVRAGSDSDEDGQSPSSIAKGTLKASGMESGSEEQEEEEEEDEEEDDSEEDLDALAAGLQQKVRTTYSLPHNVAVQGGGFPMLCATEAMCIVCRLCRASWTPRHAQEPMSRGGNLPR